MERLSRLITWLSKAFDLLIITPLAWILLGVFYMFYYPITSRPMKRLAWVFNGWMLWGALFGWTISSGLSQISDANLHKGSGYMWYGEFSERRVKVSEAEYRRENLVDGLFLTSLGLGFWVFLARAGRDEAAKAKTEADSLQAYADWLNAYRNALTAALDDATRERAEAVANSSPEVLDAQAKVPWVIRIHLPSYRTGKDLP